MATIKSLFRRFIKKYKKMPLSSNIAELRNKLLENCKRALDRLGASEIVVSAGIASLNDQKNTKTSSGAPDPHTPDYYAIIEDHKFTDALIMDFMTLIHGTMIQEWEHFLRGIFTDGVIYYLSGYDLGIPKFQVKFNELLPTNEIIEMYKNISLESEKSLKWYKEMFEQTRKVFKVREPELLKKMNKHVQVRHIFQHSQGVVRQEDLEKIGRENQYIEILNDKGKLTKYKAGQTIHLSQPEIQSVYVTIEKYSEAFQKQAEKAKPITTTLSP